MLCSLHLADVFDIYEHRDKAWIFFLSLKNITLTRRRYFEYNALVFRFTAGETELYLFFSEDVPKSLYINVSSGRRRYSTEKERIFLFWRTLWRTESAEKSEHLRHYTTLAPANQTHTDERVPCLADDGVRNTLPDPRWTWRRSYKAALSTRIKRFFFLFIFHETPGLLTGAWKSQKR